MSDQSREAAHAIHRHMVAGSLWGVAMRWSMRGLGLISIPILARILTPADFGIMAMFSLFAGLVEGFAEMGTGMLLLRQPEITRADCDTAWTLRIIQGILIGAAFLICAPFAVRYFSEPRLFPVIVVMALCSFIGATANIGATLVRKELDFAKDFRYGLYAKLATFFPTLAFAFMLRNYWALVLGNVAGAVAGVALSYRMHPYRPRLSLERARQYLSFSISVIGANIARFLKGKVDVLVIGGSTNAAITGGYNVASELATLATQEIVIPIWRGLFPAFAKITGDHDRFVAAYAYYLGAMAILCLPLGLGMWAVAGDCVAVLLGDQWKATVAPLEWLAFGATIMALVDVFAGNILFVSGHERRATALMWVHVAVLIPLVALAGRSGSAEMVAMAVTISAAILLPIAAIVLMRSIRFPAAMMWRAVWRPVLAVTVMLVTLKVLWLPREWPALFRLVAEVLLGAAIYLFSLASLWLVAGRPEGPEHAFLGVVRRALARTLGYAG